MTEILSPDTVTRIDAFYDATLRPKLAAIDDRRRDVRWLIIKSTLLVLSPVAILVAGDLLDDFLPPGWIGSLIALAWLWLVGGLVFALVRYLMPGIAAFANYRARFKQEIVPEIFKIVCPSAVYDPLQGITEAVFDAPGLFNTRGAFLSDDRVRGHIGRTPFEASEAGRAYRTGSGKNEQTYTVFRGLFFHLDFSQHLDGVVLIDPTTAQSQQLGDRTKLARVTFDNPAFEKEYTVHASSEAGARALMTSQMMAALLTLRERAGKPVFVAFKDRRAYVGVDYGRTLFEPGIARSTSKEAVREIAEHFAFVETIVRELNLNAHHRGGEADDSLLHGADIEVHPLAQLAAKKAGTVTVSDLWTTAAASIDDSADQAGGSATKPEGTRIQVDPGPGTVSITYGLRIGFWVMLSISLSGLLLASSALRAPNAPPWASPASAWVRTLPPVPAVDAFAAAAPMPWLIVGTVIFVLLALAWTGYVRRVVVDPEGIRISRAFRPFPRVYRRPLFGGAIRIKRSVYITKSEGLHVMNPTASPVLTEAEATWVVSEMKKALGDTEKMHNRRTGYSSPAKEASDGRRRSRNGAGLPHTDSNSIDPC
ncbi:MAG: DUF3137 domain-containing protein [Vicinamibacterales bacterium]